MNKTVCDRCFRDVTTVKTGYNRRLVINEEYEHDLCEECADDFYRFMKEKKE
jgi:hypothetical protein